MTIKVKMDAFKILRLRFGGLFEVGMLVVKVFVLKLRNVVFKTLSLAFMHVIKA